MLAGERPAGLKSSSVKRLTLKKRTDRKQRAGTLREHTKACILWQHVALLASSMLYVSAYALPYGSGGVG